MKILKKLGFETKEYSFTDFDPSIKLKLLKDFGLAVVCLIFSIWSLLGLKALQPFFIGIAATVIMTFIAFSNYMIFAYKKFVLIIGDVVSVDKNVKVSGIFKKKTRYGKSTITVSSDNTFYTVPTSFYNTASKGSQIAVYTTERALVQTGNDTFTVISPLAISIISQKNKYNEVNDKNLQE